jgi:hypothetical protein
MIRQMPFKLLLILSIVAAVFKDRARLVAEGIALRHLVLCRGLRTRLRPVIRQAGRCSFLCSFPKDL